MKAQFLPVFNVNLSEPQLNSTSTQCQLNFDSTSLQPQPQINLSLNINLNLTSTLVSTQYGCVIKATQSCFSHFDWAWHLLISPSILAELTQFSPCFFSYLLLVGNSKGIWSSPAVLITCLFFTIWSLLSSIGNFDAVMWTPKYEQGQILACPPLAKPSGIRHPGQVLPIEHWFWQEPWTHLLKPCPWL